MSKKSFYDFDDDQDIYSDSNKQPRRNTPQNNKRNSQSNSRNISSNSRNVQSNSRNVQSNSRNFPSAKSNNNRPHQSKQIGNIPIDKRKPVTKNQKDQINKKKKKKNKSPMRTFAKVFFSIILVCVLILTGVYVYISNLFGDIKYNKSDNDNKYINESELIGKSGVKNILLIGGDDPKGGKTFRSDTMMLVSIDTNNNKIKLSSFLRDSYLKIPGKRKNKLNSACSSGGIQLVQDTIEYNFRIKIDNYVFVDFDAFEKIIDVLGGVNVPITSREANYMNRNYKTWCSGVNNFHVNSGENEHLNGKEALLFSRIRKLDSDFKRTERQRMVMSSLKAKMSDVSMSTMLDMVKKISPYIQTDISKNEMMSLAFRGGTKYLKYDIVERSVPANDEWYSKTINGQSMVMFKDLEKTVENVREFIYE